MKLSIIVCTYNRDKHLYNVLKSIAENKYLKDHYEIVLINNNSQDNTQLECTRFQVNYPDVEFHYHIETKQGLSYARNRAIIESTGDWLIFIDDDAIMEPDYLINLFHNIDQHPNGVAFGGKIIPQFEGKEPEWISKWSYKWISALDLGDRIRIFGKNGYPIGANMGIKRTFLDKCGNFNPNLGRSKDNLLGGEGKDLFNRVKALGGRIYYFPDIVVNHIIPSDHTTVDFIAQIAKGIGKSERARTLDESKYVYFKRLLVELKKWINSLALFMYFVLIQKPDKGTILIFFRINVTKNLLFG